MAQSAVWLPVISGVLPQPTSELILFNIFINRQNAPSASLERIQNWEEWVIHRRVMVSPEGSQQTREMG